MIVAIANRKGGVGKTFVTGLLVNTFATHGHNVLVIDLDSQANLSKLVLGLERYDEIKGAGKTLDKLFAQFKDKKTADPSEYVSRYKADVKVTGRFPNIEASIIVAHEDMDETARGCDVTGRLTTELSDFLQQSIKQLSRHYDYVFLDCPPGITDGFIAAIRVADHIIVPYETDDDDRANDGINRAVAEAYGLFEEGGQSRADQIYAKPLPERARKYHTLVNKIQRNRSAQVTVASEVARRHPQFKTQIPFKPELKESVVWSVFPKLLKQRYGNDGRMAGEELYREMRQIEADLGKDKQ